MDAAGLIPLVNDIVLFHEGEVLRPYCDKCGEVLVRAHDCWICGCQAEGEACGNMTIGQGRNLDANGIRRSESDFLRDNDVREAVSGLSLHHWYLALDNPRAAALADMAFTMGVAKAMEFTDMIAALLRGDYKGGAEAMLASKWAHTEAPDRAGMDANILETGTWPANLLKANG